MRNVFALLCLLLFWGEASALKFLPLEDKEGRQILVLYDCGKNEASETCKKHEKSFSGPRPQIGYKGDAAVLELMLQERNYYQVWLYSGGGNLDEGVKVGEVLRRHRQYVLVQNNHYCVSACTVAFLGGVMREVAPNGAYKVHAYSGLLNESKEDLAPFSGPEGDTSLKHFVESSSLSGVTWVKRLFLYVQHMIGGKSDEAVTQQVLADAPDYAKAYFSGPRFRSDLERMRSEGGTTTQELLMRIERESFESRLSYLKDRADELGSRSKPAIRMLEIMFSSRIAGTAPLDHATLKENGYTNVRR